MTQKLEELFDLAPAPSKEITEALETANQIESALPQVAEDALDKDLDQLADQAVESFENLQSLGMNVTAKLGKVQKKLKQTEILLKMQKMQHDMNNDNGTEADTIEAQVFDRNELLNSFRKKQ